MTDLLLTNARVASPASAGAPGWIATSGRTIAGFGDSKPDRTLTEQRQAVDVGGANVLPGFIDVHVHGAVGHEVMDGDVQGLRAMSGFFASHGVTSFVPTTWTAATEATLTALHAVAAAARTEMPGAQVLGAHMEGPYLSHGRCGAQDPLFVRLPDLTEAQRFLDTETVRLITIAPELAGARALMDLCRSHGVRISVGHTEASYEQVVRAVSWGARHMTHTFNAMPPLHHRQPGPVAAAMTLPELLAELIADNHHVHPAVLGSFVRAKGPDGVILVTDALRPTGLPAGEFTIGGRPPPSRAASPG